MSLVLGLFLLSLGKFATFESSVTSVPVWRPQTIQLASGTTCMGQCYDFSGYYSYQLPQGLNMYQRTVALQVWLSGPVALHARNDGSAD